MSCKTRAEERAFSFFFKQLHSKVLTVKTNTTLQCWSRKKLNPNHRNAEKKKINQVMPNLITTALTISFPKREEKENKDSETQNTGIHGKYQTNVRKTRSAKLHTGLHFPFPLYVYREREGKQAPFPDSCVSGAGRLEYYL